MDRPHAVIYRNGKSWRVELSDGRTASFPYFTTGQPYIAFSEARQDAIIWAKQRTMQSDGTTSIEIL